MKNVDETNEHGVIKLYDGSDPLHEAVLHVESYSLYTALLYIHMNKFVSCGFSLLTVPWFYVTVPLLSCTPLSETRCDSSSHGTAKYGNCISNG
jgi:hypothetical protein